MLNKNERAFLEKAKRKPSMINYLYGELTDTNKIIDVLGIDKNSVVLDVGVGKGTFLTKLIMKAGCKGIGIEPILERYQQAVSLMKKYNLEDKLELQRAHYPCKLILRPTHVILHACAFSEKNIKDVYDALPRNVKILHNSLKLKRYAHNDKNNQVDVKTTYTKHGSKFWLHEK